MIHVDWTNSSRAAVVVKKMPHESDVESYTCGSHFVERSVYFGGH
jgi:hypothetical protein